MNDAHDEQDERREQDKRSQPEPREATQQRAPERELELNLKKHPHDANAKVDVGSDQSMDASDPVAATAPGGNDPVPSSTYPEDE